MLGGGSRARGASPCKSGSLTGFTALHIHKQTSYL